MKIKGKKINPWEPDPLVFENGKTPEGKPDFIVFKARGIKDFSEFEALCPRPTPQGGAFTRNGWEAGKGDPAHKQAVKDWDAKQWAWMAIKTLEPSEIEWDRVKLDNPDTWLAYEEELKAGLTFFQYGLVKALINEANSLDDQKLEANRDTFFQPTPEKQAS